MTDSQPALQFAVYRFTLRPLEPIHLPPNAGSTLRGGFGSAFKRTACFQRSRPPDSCEGCSVAHNCPYGYVFETRVPPDSEVLRSQREIPHPFVLEPPLQPAPVYEPGAALEFRAVLVGRAIACLPHFAFAFARLGETGIGRGRGRFELEEVRAEHPLTGRAEAIYRRGSLLPCPVDLTVAYSDLVQWCRGAEPERLTVRFLTPTRLVSEERLVASPSFAVLVRSALRRLSSLSYFHGGRRWETDYRGTIARAEAVRTADADLRWEDWERYSSRQDARMKLGGVVGTAVYEGRVVPFLPLLLAASIAHVGKACTFGNGRLEVRW
ncbi:MAG: CRISPR system precrRNA processing endoribonuclease RAMP protein Cas6 [Sphingomonadaceae bacterium]